MPATLLSKTPVIELKSFFNAPQPFDKLSAEETFPMLFANEFQPVSILGNIFEVKNPNANNAGPVAMPNAPSVPITF